MLNFWHFLRLHVCVPRKDDEVKYTKKAHFSFEFLIILRHQSSVFFREEKDKIEVF